MTPKEKAAELVDELCERSLGYFDACIAANYLVEEIIKSKPLEPCPEGFREVIEGRTTEVIKYWEQVKEEIGK